REQPPRISETKPRQLQQHAIAGDLSPRRALFLFFADSSASCSSASVTCSPAASRMVSRFRRRSAFPTGHPSARLGDDVVGSLVGSDVEKRFRLSAHAGG